MNDELKLATQDGDRTYWEVFHRPGGFEKVRALAMRKEMVSDQLLQDAVYNLYLAHVRHTIATTRDFPLLHDLSEQLFAIRDLLSRDEGLEELRIKLGVLEDMVDDACACATQANDTQRSSRTIREEILRHLSTEPLPTNTLMSRVRLGPANCLRLLNMSEEYGYVRPSLKDDARHVALTESGVALLGKVADVQ